MKDKTQPTRTLTKNGPRLISERKLKANRENARKSTGPRTARGKAFSRRNAVKHGLCAKDLFPLLHLPTESEQEFLEFHERLREEHQPVGFEEEWEVGRIAIYRWRLGRVWRYENAEISRAILDAHYKQLQDYTRYLESRQKSQLKHESQISADFDAALSDAEKEIGIGNGIPADFKSRLATAEFPNRSLCELHAKHQLENNPELLKLSPTQDSDSVLAYLTARSVIDFANLLPDLVPFTESLKVSCDQQAIPNRDAVDRMIRYEAAAERNLSKALDRLETLQRRRRGEAFPLR